MFILLIEGRASHFLSIIVRGAALSFLALLVGCSSSGKLSSDAAKIVEFKQTAKLQMRWQGNIADAGNTVLQPAVTNDALYVASAQGDVIRLDRATGKRIWRIKTGFNISAGVGAGENVVLLGGNKGELVALDTDGKVRWQMQMSSEVLGVPRVAEGVVVVRTGDGHISALNVAEGKSLWSYERATPSLVVRNHAAVEIHLGTVYAGLAAGRLVALNLATGVVKWETVISQPRGNTELERISDITSTPVIDADQVCAIAFQGRLACFNLAQGNLLWSRELSSDQGMVLWQKYLYVTGIDGSILALDKNSGSSIWKNEQMKLRRVTAPGVFGDYLAVGDYEGYLHILRREDGRLVARSKTDASPVQSAPVPLGEGLFIQTHKGGLFSFLIH